MGFYRNLIPGQWQLGDIVWGKGTNIKIESTDIKAYDINAQDYQVARADEARFGFDSHKPTTIEFSLQILTSHLLQGFENEIPNFWHSMPNVHDLQREWRFDEGRNIWGQMKPLYVCSKLDDLPKIVFGRPGQFSYTADDEFNHGEVMKVVAEFRRGDTYSYSVAQNAIFMNSSQLVTSLIGSGGNGPSWLEIILQGPITHPILTFQNLYQQSADIVIDLNYDIAADEQVQITGEPWTRRVINNGSPALNLSANLIGATPYLDRLRFNYNQTVGISLAGGGMTTNTGVAILWRDAYQVI